MIRISLFTLGLLISVPAVAELKPIAVEWPREVVKSPVDVSFLLEAPAGKEGFVRVVDGHLALASGKRLRIWGVNFSGKAVLPPKEDAAVIAAHLARLGVNGVRFHFFDRPAPGGIMDAARKDTRALDPAQLDKLDMIVAELKKRGIYTNLNLNVARPFKSGDGVRDVEYLGFSKALTHFDPRIIELQKEYASQLLTHKNPYTGNEYRNEPAVAIVELLNENSLTEAWMGGRLTGKAMRKNPGTWGGIPTSYAEELDKLYNAWLEKNVAKDLLAKIRAEAKVAEGQPIPRLAPAEFGKASADRFRTEAAFYMATEEAFLADMKKYLKDELKVQSLLVANSDHGHHKTGLPQTLAGSLLDVVDGHVYWQHPSYIEDPKTGKKTGFTIPNTPMVEDPLHSSVVELSRSAVAGKPYTVSETNHPFPSAYACEGVPILAAYAALQDWDGVFLYTLCHDDLLAMKPVFKGHFDFAPDPVRVPQIAAGALMFLRGDIAPAKQTVERTYTRQQVIDSIRMPYKERPYFTPGFDLSTPLRHAVRIKSFEGPETAVRPGQAGTEITSDTGELTWLHGAAGKSLVGIDSARTQAMVGYVGQSAREFQVSRLRARDVKTPFAAIVLSSLEDKPIAQSGKLLLTAGSTVENTEMVWDAKRRSLEKWGNQPTRAEVVTGPVTIKVEGAKRVTATPLDGAGRAMGQVIEGKQTAAGWELGLGGVATTWYVVGVER